MIVSTSASQTATTNLMDTDTSNKLDPFFLENFEQAISNKQLIVDLCFEKSPSAHILKAIKAEVQNVQATDPIASEIKVPCWAVRTQIAQSSLFALLQTEGLFKMVLIEPVPSGAYISKLDNLVQTLARYRQNSETLHVFVHVNQEFTHERLNELETLGLHIRPETWLPSSGPNSTGFYIGELPIRSLVAVAKLNDIVRITSAERELRNSSP